MNINKGTVTTEKFSMDYCRFGDGRRAMVILPGLSVQKLTGSAKAIAAQYKLFSEDFTVYLFDRVDNPPHGYSISDMASDTLCAIDFLSLDDICLFGASQGGMIAMETAAMCGKIKKLAVCSSAARIGKCDALEKWRRLAENGDRKALYLSFAETVYPRDFFEKYKDAFITLSESVTDAELERFIALIDATADFDCLQNLSELEIPLLVVGSRDDRVLGFEPTGEIIGLMQSKKDFEYHIYDGYGHASYDTAPDFTQRLYRFFI